MSDPEYEYQPWPDERRERASVLARRRVGTPDGHRTVYGVHVPDEHAERIRVAAAKLAGKSGYSKAAEFVRKQKLSGFKKSINRHWSIQEDAALRRYHYAGKNAREIAENLGRTRNSIIGRRYRLELRSPLKGCRIMPIGEVRRMAADHFGEGVCKEDVIAGSLVIAPLFIRATLHNIAAYTGISIENVRAMAARLRRGGVWDERGLIDKERYLREAPETDLLLVMDTLLARGIVKRTVNASGEELWSAR